MVDGMKRSRKNLVVISPGHGALVASILLALLFARFAPGIPPQAPLPRSAASCVTAHLHRPCMDREQSDWATPSSTYVPMPEVLPATQVDSALELNLPFSDKGSQYNRPPPLA